MKAAVRGLRRSLRARLRHAIRANAPDGRVLLVFVSAEPRRYPRAFEAFQTLALGFRPGHATIVRVEQDPRSACIGHDGCAAPRADAISPYVIPGDRSAWEFSGWQSGIRWASAAGVPFDHVICANDALLNGARDRWGLEELQAAFNAWSLPSMTRGIFGRIDASAASDEIDGRACRRWVRTNCFVLDARTAREVDFAQLAPVTDGGGARDPLDRFASREWSGSVFRADAPVSEDLRAFLVDWLQRGWHRAGSIGAANWPNVRGKLRAILHERLLSANVVGLGGALQEPGPSSLWLGMTAPGAPARDPLSCPTAARPLSAR